ncbi:unnamed protein product [Soboliphyme baturini]|uniref:Uncharacterized protein n=1 Tax=Soboliphyme baturini TaxID=241478 RepID=A0A183J7T0_9BILA|nr:unnamed protein product [Soboliphyme baturini]
MDIPQHEEHEVVLAVLSTWLDVHHLAGCTDPLDGEFLAQSGPSGCPVVGLPFASTLAVTVLQTPGSNPTCT